MGKVTWDSKLQRPDCKAKSSNQVKHLSFCHQEKVQFHQV